MFRFRNYGKHKINEKLADFSIEPRLNQIMLPLLAIIQEEPTQEDLKDIMRSLNQRILEDRGMSLEADILRIILELQAKPETTKIRVSEITNTLNNREENTNEVKLTPRRIGQIIGRNLQLSKRREGNGYLVIAKPEELERLKKKYGI